MKTKILFTIILIAATAAAASAQVRRKRTPVRRPVAKKTISSPESSTGAVKTASGLTYIITKHGTGAAAKAGDTVTVHYTGTLTDGTKFDSSRDRGQPFSFTLGAGQVIKGWDEGIGKLRVGDQAILIIPPTIGYGARGAGDAIPPNASLIFIVELVETKPADR
jgi:FKBP-type peptidyl-prolyl cis-trans isomerase